MNIRGWGNATQSMKNLYPNDLLRLCLHLRMMITPLKWWWKYKSGDHPPPYQYGPCWHRTSCIKVHVKPFHGGCQVAIGMSSRYNIHYPVSVDWFNLQPASNSLYELMITAIFYKRMVSRMVECSTSIVLFPLLIKRGLNHPKLLQQIAF